MSLIVRLESTETISFMTKGFLAAYGIPTSEWLPRVATASKDSFRNPNTGVGQEADIRQDKFITVFVAAGQGHYCGPDV